MVTVRTMLERWGFDLVALTGDAIEARSDEVVDLNREQMLAGVDSKGKPIEPPYSFATVAIKRQKGQQFNHVTLRDKGEFQGAMFIKIEQDRYKLDSADSKTADIRAKYGDEVFGLTSENKRRAWIEVKPNVIRSIKSITGSI